MKRSSVIVSISAHISKYQYWKVSIRVDYSAVNQQHLKPGSVPELNSRTLWTDLVLVPNVRQKMSTTCLKVSNNLRPFALQDEWVQEKILSPDLSCMKQHVFFLDFWNKCIHLL